MGMFDKPWPTLKVYKVLFKYIPANLRPPCCLCKDDMFNDCRDNLVHCKAWRDYADPSHGKPWMKNHVGKHRVKSAQFARLGEIEW
jgi:hypothetical protein